MGLFVLSVCLGVLFLFLPGYLMLRGVSFTGPVSFACAPLATISVYSIVCVCLSKAHVFCAWYTLFVPSLVLGCLMILAHYILVRKKKAMGEQEISSDRTKTSSGNQWFLSNWAIVALYVVVGLIVASVCFACILDGQDSFVQDYDNAHHLGISFSFVETGSWSPLSASLYATAADAQINPLPGGGFYPTVWNTFCAMLMSCLGVSATLATNAVNFLFIAVVFCSGMAILMRTLFSKDIGPVLFGSLCTLGFSAFPWMLLDFGPLYPNMSAFCLVPAFCFVFISIFTPEISVRRRLIWIALLVLGVITCAFTQPNAVFTAAVFLAPFCVYQAALAADLLHVPAKRKRVLRFLFGAAAAMTIVVIWWLLYRAPFLNSVVTHSWAVSASRLQAFYSALSLSFNALGIQLILSILVIVGGIRTLRNREYLCLSASYAIAALIYIACVSSDGPIQHLLGGFWYTDSFRAAAFAELFAIPLAALGMWTVAQGCVWVVHRFRSGLPENSVLITSACIIAVVFLVSNFYFEGVVANHSPIKSSFYSVLAELKAKNGSDIPKVYSKDEQEFVKKAQEVVAPDDLILNVPEDGTVFSYGHDGARMYYRYLRPYGESNETEDSKIIRNHLVDIATDPSVKKAVSDVEAKYLLVLDQGLSKDTSPRLFTYEGGANWTGIEAITDDTPGFEVVLSQDDMRLYRIVA